VSTSNSSYAAEKRTHETMVKEIDKIAAPLKRRTLWMEVLKAVNECLPREEGEPNADLSLHKKIRIQSLYSQKADDVSEWHAAIAASEKNEEFASPSDRANAPSGEGYIFTLRGYHLYNHDSIDFRDAGVEFIKDTLADNLKQWTIERDGISIPVGQLGISHPVVVYDLDDTILWHPSDRLGAPGNARPMNRPGGLTAGKTLMGRRGSQGSDDDDDDADSGYGRNGRGLYGQTNRRPGLQPIDDIAADEAEHQQFDKTIFTLQFAWVPILEGDRSAERPEPKAAPATGSVKRGF
jgi:type IV pilus assembly protein PilM